MSISIGQHINRSIRSEVWVRFDIHKCCWTRFNGTSMGNNEYTSDSQ